ncbi:MAG TPA: S9 family peptidase [Steroidobacteraceae bacterium]|nr:S9 family peptidase [Steroidobacteraceae bacterium]
MRPRLLALTYLIATMALLSSPAKAEKLTIERLFAAPDLSGATLRSARISPDGRLVTYLRGAASNKDRMDLWAYDLSRHQHRLLVDASRLVPEQRALSTEEEQRRERQRTSSLSGIIEYEFSPDSRYLLVPLAGDLYLYDLHAQPEQAVRRLTHGAGYATDAKFSPAGHYVSYVRDHNLFVCDLATGTETAVTHEGHGPISFGVAEFIAQEEMSRTTGYWWSPDEKRIAYTRVDETPVPEIERFEIYADGAKVVRQRYPSAGSANANVSLFVAAVTTPAVTTPAEATLPPRTAGPKVATAQAVTRSTQTKVALSDVGQPAPVKVELGSDPDVYLARVNWFPDSSALAIQRQTRDQKTLTLLRADPASGATTELLTERSDTWVELNDELTFLARSRQFIWGSQRTGYEHLYLYDWNGNLVRPLTQGEWQVTGDNESHGLRGVDEERGLVYFLANTPTPLERHLYSVSLSNPSAPMHRITTESGWHAVAMSSDTRMFLDTFSTPDQPPSVTLRNADSTVIAALVPNQITRDHPYAPYVADHLPTEFGTLQAADGQTLHYQIIKPRPLLAGKRYPVIVDVYGGPGNQRVRNAWGGYPRSNEGFFRQYLAQQGYVVFTLDNRGSGSRGVRFETALYHHFGSVEVDDQVAGVAFLKSLPYVDPGRVGVFGWSYGGYMALMCMLRAPDVFAAGVAGAPVTDWTLYDTHYTERYMGTPKENPQGYLQSGVLEHAAQLRGALLIMHGMADDNVLFANSTKLFKTLQDLDEPFDVMTYPGGKHGLLRHADMGPHAYMTVKRFFDRTLGNPVERPQADPADRFRGT